MANGLMGPPTALRNDPRTPPIRDAGGRGLFGNIGEAVKQRGLLGSLLSVPGQVLFGADIGGLMATNRDITRAENEARRDQLRASQRLPGILSGEEEVSQAELMGLLGQIAPEQVAGGLLGQFFPGEERAAPAQVRIAQFIHPNDPDAQRQFVADQFQNDQDMQNLGERLQLQLAELKLRQTERDMNREERERAESDRLVAETGINTLGSISGINNALDLLEGTALEPGLGFEGGRTTAAQLQVGLSRFFGRESKEMETALSAQAELQRLASSASFTLAGERLQEFGTITDTKFRAAQNALQNPNAPIAAQRLAAADLAEATIQMLDRRGVEVPNRGRVQRNIRLRREQARRVLPGSPQDIEEFMDGFGVGTKPPSEMTDAELEAAIRAERARGG